MRKGYSTAYERCRKKLEDAQYSRLQDIVTKYEVMGDLHRFLLCLVSDKDLEAKAAEDILAERKKDHDRWLASVGPGKIN